jgi:hypothetical protein
MDFRQKEDEQSLIQDISVNFTREELCISVALNLVVLGFLFGVLIFCIHVFT